MSAVLDLLTKEAETWWKCGTTISRCNMASYAPSGWEPFQALILDIPDPDEPSATKRARTFLRRVAAESGERRDGVDANVAEALEIADALDKEASE